jgi:peroxiredoxin
MFTPDQAYRLFVYADWTMLLLGLALFVAAIGWGISALLPRSRGRRRKVLLRATICLLITVLFYGTQASVTIAFFNRQWTALQLVLFGLPVAIMLAGLSVSLTYGIVGILRRSGLERRQMALRSLMWVVIFGVGIAPHTLAVLMPIISYSDRDFTNYPGTIRHAGEPTPDFQVTCIDGAPFQLSDLRGHVIVLNFFATWCGPCQDELPHLESIWNEFRNNSHFRMLVVGREESDDAVKSFQQTNGFTFPMAADPNSSIYSKFASEHIPRTYLITGDGTILYESTGYSEQEIVRLKKLITKEVAKTNL